MGLFDSLFRKQLPVGRPIFGFFSGNVAPDMVATEYLAAYQSWAYTAVNAIADDVASMDIILQKRTTKGWDTVVLRPMPSPTPHRVAKVIALADTRQDALTKREEDGDELWYVHGATWLKLALDDESNPAIKCQMVLF